MNIIKSLFVSVSLLASSASVVAETPWVHPESLPGIAGKVFDNHPSCIDSVTNSCPRIVVSKSWISIHWGLLNIIHIGNGVAHTEFIVDGGKPYNRLAFHTELDDNVTFDNTNIFGPISSYDSILSMLSSGDNVTISTMIYSGEFVSIDLDLNEFNIMLLKLNN